VTISYGGTIVESPDGDLVSAGRPLIRLNLEGVPS
jgi:hypothetical protein